jgi:toxin ParE1/3/4
MISCGFSDIWRRRYPDAAERLIEAIDTRFENLAQFPFIGRERSTLAPGLRSMLVETHLIFYVVKSERIVVVRVIDGRMDIDEEFQK